MKSFNMIFVFVLITVTQSVFGGQDSLIGYWSFDKFSFADNFFRDETGNSNNGITHEVVAVDGIKGKALLFDGSTSYAEILGEGENAPAEISDLSIGSISLWFKVEHIPLDHGIAPILYFGASEKCDFFDAANQGLIIELGHSPIYPENEHIFYTVWSNGCTFPSLCFDSGFKITKEKWHHYVVVINENSNTAYFNGVELKERWYNFGEEDDRQFFADALEKQKLWLGKGHWDRTEQFFDGAIDELKIFNKALSAEEVQNLYNEVKLTSFEELEIEDPSVKIYPNPVNDVLKIDTKNIDFQIKYISLTDLNGKQLIVIDAVNNINHMNLSTWQEGVYIVNIVGETRSVRRKLIMAK